MVHETGVHAVDALAAVGRDPAMPVPIAPVPIAPVPIAPVPIATDGMDEFLDNLPCAAYFAPAVNELRGTVETLAFVATDQPVRWRVTLGPDRFRWDHDDAPTDATIAAAADLLLVVYSRLPSAGMVTGDAAVAEQWLRHASI
jgi:hypothetical protein